MEELKSQEVEAAIAYFEDAIKESDEIINECTPALQAELTEQKQHFVVALDALRCAAPENKPLTLEELRQMGGKPVYMVYVQHERDGWMLDDDADDYVYEVCHNGATAYARKSEGSA